MRCGGSVAFARSEPEECVEAVRCRVGARGGDARPRSGRDGAGSDRSTAGRRHRPASARLSAVGRRRRRAARPPAERSGPGGAGPSRPPADQPSRPEWVPVRDPCARRGARGAAPLRPGAGGASLAAAPARRRGGPLRACRLSGRQCRVVPGGWTERRLRQQPEPHRGRQKGLRRPSHGGRAAPAKRLVAARAERASARRLQRLPERQERRPA